MSYESTKKSVLLHKYASRAKYILVIGISNITDMVSIIIANPTSTIIVFEPENTENVRALLQLRFDTRNIMLAFYKDMNKGLETYERLNQRRKFDFVVVNSFLGLNTSLIQNMVIRGNTVFLNAKEYVDSKFDISCFFCAYDTKKGKPSDCRSLRSQVRTTIIGEQSERSERIEQLPPEEGEGVTTTEGSDDYIVGVIKNVHNFEIELVVCRWTRNLDWLYNVNLIRTSIYVNNKGNPFEISLNNTTIVNIPNVGLDQYAHLRYIIDNYDNLANIVIFLQDHIIDHRDIYGRRGILLENENEMIDQMVMETKQYGFSQNADSYLDFNRNLLPSYGFRSESIGFFHDWFDIFIREDFDGWDKPLLWYKNAIFGVKKEYILTNPKKKYEKLLEVFVDVKSHHTDFLERGWYYLLNLDRGFDT